MAAQPTPLAQQLLQRALSPDEADTRYERFLKRPLILRPTSPEPSARALRRRLLNEKKDRAKKRKALKPRPLSAAKKRQLGLLEIPKEQRKYTIYEPLHDLWLGYVRDILGLVATEGSSDVRWHVQTEHAGAMISSGDMHGALLEVVRSRSVSRVGLKGIVLRDSQYVFEIITKKDEIKTIPKEHTLFRMEVPPPKTSVEQHALKPLVFELSGDLLQTRAPDRANKKYKTHYQPDR